MEGPAKSFKQGFLLQPIPSMLTIDTNEGISLLQDFLSLEILRCNIFALANFY